MLSRQRKRPGIVGQAPRDGNRPCLADGRVRQSGGRDCRARHYRNRGRHLIVPLPRSNLTSCKFGSNAASMMLELAFWRRDASVLHCRRRFAEDTSNKSSSKSLDLLVKKNDSKN